MQVCKPDILNNYCNTDLVYGRINKKLDIDLSREEIREFISKALHDAPLEHFIKKGKNFYITSTLHLIRITVNSYTFRIITVDNITDEL